MGFPGGSAGKESACNLGDLGSIPGLERSPWSRERLPTPVFWNFPYAFVFDPWGTYAWVCAESLQSCLSLYDPMDYSTSGASVLGSLQARILERVATPSSRHLPNPGMETTSLMSPALQAGFFTIWATWQVRSMYKHAF